MLITGYAKNEPARVVPNPKSSNNRCSMWASIKSFAEVRNEIRRKIEVLIRKKIPNG